MSAIATFARLQSLGSPLVTTAEAAAALRTSGSGASRVLRTLAEHGLVRRLRYGLWSLETGAIDPRRLASEITRPYPAYVSFESALSAHGMIDQLPRNVTLASLDRAKLVKTTLATFAVHHLPPELFGGFETRGGIPLATPQKALFDYYYVAHAHKRHRRRLPEVELPSGFSRRDLWQWTERIRSRQLRTQVAASLDRVLKSGDESAWAGS